jgi:hypothetical protein
VTLTIDETYGMLLDAAAGCVRGEREVGEEAAEYLRRAHDLINLALAQEPMFGIGDDERRSNALPTAAQFEAIRRRMGAGRPAPTIFLEPFDLPAGYVLVRFTDGFECGISREGEVSS